MNRSLVMLVLVAGIVTALASVASACGGASGFPCRSDNVIRIVR